MSRFLLILIFQTANAGIFTSSEKTKKLDKTLKENNINKTNIETSDNKTDNVHNQKNEDNSNGKDSRADADNKADNQENANNRDNNRANKVSSEMSNSQENVNYKAIMKDEKQKIRKEKMTKEQTLEELFSETFSAQLKNASEIEMIKKELLEQRVFRSIYGKKSHKLNFMLDATAALYNKKNDKDEYFLDGTYDLRFKVFNSNLRGEFSLYLNEEPKVITNTLKISDLTAVKFLAGAVFPNFALLASNSKATIYPHDPINILDTSVSNGSLILANAFNTKVYGIGFTLRSLVGTKIDDDIDEQKIKGMLFLEGEKTFLNSKNEKSQIQLTLGVSAIQENKEALKSLFDFNYDLIIGANITTDTEVFKKLVVGGTYYSVNSDKNLNSVLNLGENASILANLQLEFKILPFGLRVGILEQNLPSQPEYLKLQRSDLDNIYQNIEDTTSRFIFEITGKSLNPYYIYEKDLSAFGAKAEINGRLNLSADLYTLIDFAKYHYKSKLSNELIDIRAVIEHDEQEEGLGVALKKKFELSYSSLELVLSAYESRKERLNLNGSFSFLELESSFLEDLSEKATIAGYMSTDSGLKNPYYSIYAILNGNMNFGNYWNLAVNVAPGFDINEDSIKEYNTKGGFFNFFQLGWSLDAKCSSSLAKLEAKVGNFKLEEIKESGFDTLKESAFNIDDISFKIQFTFGAF